MTYDCDMCYILALPYTEYGYPPLYLVANTLHGGEITNDIMKATIISPYDDPERMFKNYIISDCDSYDVPVDINGMVDI